MVLTSIIGAAAAAVTHGDLMVVADPKREGKVDNVCRMKFYSPKGRVKASVRVAKGFNWVFARAVSQDGRYAAVGLYFSEDGGTRAFGPPKVPLKIVFLELSGPSPKVLGTRTLRYVHNYTWNRGKHCHIDGGNPLALRSQSASAGTVLHVYLSIVCVPATLSDDCIAFHSDGGHAAIQHWSVIHKPTKKLGPLVTGKRVAFPEKTTCDTGASALSLTVTASGKAYVAFVFNVATHVRGIIGVYEIRHSRSGRIRLVATWKLKGGLTSFQLTGPSTGCALAETPRGYTKIYSLGKGRRPYIGGKVASGSYYFGRHYQDVACTNSLVYAILATDFGTTPDSVLRVSVEGLRKSAIGHVIFKAAHDSIPNILIVP